MTRIAILAGLMSVAICAGADEPASQSNRVLLFDEIVKVPRAQWRGLTVSLKQRPAMIEAEHQLMNGGGSVRVLIMSREEVDRFREGRSHRALAATEYGRQSKLRHLITRPGEYMVLLDSRRQGSNATLVQLKVSLTYEPEHVSFEPRTLSPQRRFAVIAVSLAGFAVVGGWSGWKLWLVTLRRRRAYL